MGDSRAARYSDLFGAEEEHLPDCAFCPICSVIAVLRRSRPEAVEHLGQAARDLFSAAMVLLAEAEAEDAAPASAAGSRDPAPVPGDGTA